VADNDKSDVACLEKLCLSKSEEHKSKLEKYRETETQFYQAAAELEELETEYRQMSEELCLLKKHSPEAASVLSEFELFEGIPPTVTKQHPVCIFSSNNQCM